ncbi:MAG: DEAD/DEAH box helicase family protein [Oscillospiraceae bacterium]|nr:DEAD/DEAH box helicase family protein [Oscillospiraceae bacterium]
MARPFSTSEARQIIRQHQKLAAALHTVIETAEEYQDSVKQTSDEIIAREVLNILADIPVEEINRGKRGFRIKALRDSGYNTVADLYTASIFSLASVYGISEDSAYAIKEVVNEIVSKAQSGVKIRLSTDDKNPSSTKLVFAISKYKNYQPIADECQRLLYRYEDTIDSATEALEAGSNGIKWFFSSGAKKQKAADAFELLCDLMDGPYGKKAWDKVDETVPITDTSEQDAWKDFTANSIRFFNILEDINPGILGNTDAIYGLPEDLAREVQEEDFFPEGLICELRRYQEWGVKYILHQERVLLGDEMGLGKTVQAIAAMVSLRNTGATHFMVVCPASVITNWCREIRKMSLLSVTKIHGSGRKAALQAWLNTGGVAVTTYETTGSIKLPDNYTFSLLVVDEAHYIKNTSARRTINVKNLCGYTQRLLFMTGTALENRVEEMIALIDILKPAVARTISRMAFMKAAPQFREAVAPVYYRRKRDDVLTELPELIESQEWCALGAMEESIYENSVLGRNYADIRRVSWNVDDLRDSSKAIRMLEIINEATGDGRKIIVFSFFLDTIRKIRLLLGERCLEPINGSVPPARRQEILDQFEKAPAGSVLTAQIQSGGTGLNIQAASVVIICEPQLKPSIENQAISRAYRMGQTRNVLVYRLLCENTVDERIVELLENKQAVFDAFADKSVAAEESMAIDDRTFGNIIEEEIERINQKNGITMPKKAENKSSSNKSHKTDVMTNITPSDQHIKPVLDQRSPQTDSNTPTQSNIEPSYTNLDLDAILAEFHNWAGN